MYIRKLALLHDNAENYGHIVHMRYTILDKLLKLCTDMGNQFDVEVGTVVFTGNICSSTNNHYLKDCIIRCLSESTGGS